MASSFDAGLWRLRSARRFAASKNDPALLRDFSAIENVERVVMWCTRRGLSVEFMKVPHTGGHCSNTKIVINSRSVPEQQLFILLHECGHSLLGTFNEPNHRTMRSVAYRVGVVAEEDEAWCRGLKLARRLQLNIDVEKFHRAKASALKTYMAWVLRNEKS